MTASRSGDGSTATDCSRRSSVRTSLLRSVADCTRVNTTAQTQSLVVLPSASETEPTMEIQSA